MSRKGIRWLWRGLGHGNVCNYCGNIIDKPPYWSSEGRKQTKRYHIECAIKCGFDIPKL